MLQLKIKAYFSVPRRHPVKKNEIHYFTNILSIGKEIDFKCDLLPVV